MWPWVLGGTALLLVLAAGSGSGPRARPPARPRPPRLPGIIPPLTSNYATSPFGFRIHPVHKDWREHTGLDLRAPIGTPVFSPVDGVVTAIRSGGAGGNRIAVTGAGYRWWFLHLSSAGPGIVLGSPVKQGQIVAVTGNSGTSTTGPHLHFQVEDVKTGDPVDPVYLYPPGTFQGRAAVAALVAGEDEPELDEGDVLAVDEALLHEAFGHLPEADQDEAIADTAAVTQTWRLGLPEALAVVQAARFVGGSGTHLARVIWAESRMRPDAVNAASGATGLIQFMPATMKHLGVTPEALKRMSFVRQMDYVSTYLVDVANGEWAGGTPGPLDTQFKMAAAVFYPAWRNRAPATVLPEKVRTANPGISTMGEYLDFVLAARPPRRREAA